MIVQNPPTSPERRACETTFHQPAAASQQQPASCSQPAKPASQASQPAKPANVASGHRSLRPPGIDGSKLLYRGIQSVSTARHSPPQVATGCHRLPNLLAPTAPGGQPNMPQTHQISTIWPTSQQIMWGGSFGSLISRPPDKAGQGEAPPCLQA